MTHAELVQLARDTAQRHQLPPALVCAVVEQESGWNTYALRSESLSGFMNRYGAAYVQIVAASATKLDDRWLPFEDIFYASYGLMQTMYPVVVEMLPDLAGRLAYPTELCKPENGLEAGCRILLKKFAHAQGNTERALLLWNGGGHKAYPAEVLARVPRYE